MNLDENEIKEIYDNIINCLEALKNLRDSGQLSEDDFYKMVVVASLDYLDVEDAPAAKALLSSIPSEYYTNAFAIQIQEDEEFLDAAYQLAEALVEVEALDMPPDDIAYTMARGDA